MGFTYNNEEWIPKTTSEHALAWMEGINALLEQEGVTDDDGNILKISQNYANALYLQVLAGASRLAVNDEKLSAAIDSFNVSVCDDQQVENLLPIAAISRNAGSYSTLVLTVTASDDGECTIPAGTKAPFGSVNFVTQTEVILQPGTTQNITTVCDTVGAVVVLTGEVTEFDTQIPNLETVINNVSSTPGNDAETTASLRRRIIKGNTIPYSLDGVKIALEELTGINHARVFFNYNTSGTITLAGNIVLQPRTAYIVVNGESDSLASTYAKYMSAPTQNAPGASSTGTQTTVNVIVTAGENGATVPANTQFVYDGMTFTNASAVTIAAAESETILFSAVDVGAVVIPSGAITEFSEEITGVELITNEASTPGLNRTAYEQNYVTASGQSIPIKYDTAEDETVYVKIFLMHDAETGTQITNQLKRDLISASASWVIGEQITSLLTSVPFDGCTYTTVAYTQVSLDGETWQNLIETPANAIPRISDDTIEVDVL